MHREITDDLELLLSALPPHICEPIRQAPDRANLLEIVMDLGREPEARYPGREVILSSRDVTEEDIEYVVSRIGVFGDDNRAGIERTLHRISAIRNRKSRIVGLTCRVGRAVFGTIRIIQDLVGTGQSILMLGRPGVGKTTMLREMARVLADDLQKRVVIVDTSNEIGGDGDIPHPAIGRSRRMQVPTPNAQHAVMIEAVENHMPEVIVIDEIGTELEASAARTIAERGVQLIGTAHGNTLENLMLNPTLSDLVGGITTVTLSDEEARRRGTQKSVLERKAPPTFDVLVEIQSWDRVAVHTNVAETVDALLRGHPPKPEIRSLGDDGEIRRELAAVVTLPSGQRPRHLPQVPHLPAPPVASGGPSGSGGSATAFQATTYQGPSAPSPVRRKAIYPFGVSRSKIEEAARELDLPVGLADSLNEADLVMTVKNYYRRRAPALREAEARGLPVYVLKSAALLQIEQALASLFDLDVPPDPMNEVVTETESAIAQVLNGDETEVELAPQNAYIRRIQHELAQRYNLSSESRGKEPRRRVLISRTD
jgi:stage III sporulation protein SpoIIIAA